MGVNQCVKSHIGIVLRELFGDNMLTGNIHRIETDRFFRYNLKDRLLMVDDDMQMQVLSSTDYIKNLVTAEIPIYVEAKGKQSEQALLYTRLLCFGNGNPKTLYDKSKGFSRRMIILTTQTPPENRVIDPFIAEKFIAEKEKIFCRMYDGLCRLIANRYRFTISERAKKNVMETMQDNCNITEFLKDTDRVQYGETLRTSSSALYDSYYHWCEDNALTALKRETFVTWLRQNEADYNIKYDCNIPSWNSHVRGFKGITVKYKANGYYGVQACKARYYELISVYIVRVITEMTCNTHAVRHPTRHRYTPKNTMLRHLHGYTPIYQVVFVF